VNDTTQTATRTATVKWCSVPCEEARASMRLEASVFGIDGRHARIAVANCPFPSKVLAGKDGLGSAYVCGRFKRVWLGKSDLPIYQPSAITDIKPEPDGYLSEVTQTDLNALRVRKGQILLSCSGTIGKVGYVAEALKDQIFSHDLIRLDARVPHDAGYLYAYLRSRTGNTILQTGKYGAVIQHIEPAHLADIPVPNAPDAIKTKIHNLVVDSYARRDESNALIDEATALLVKELKLPPIEHFQKSRVAFSTDSKELAGRFDASYHIPAVRFITAHLRKHAAEVTTISDVRTSKNIFLPGRFKRIYVEEGQGRIFFSGKDIGALDPSDKKYLSFARHGNRIRNDLTIRHNMILVTCSGSIGRVVLVPLHWDGWTMTHDIIRLVPNEETTGFLYIWLQSDYGKLLVTAKAYGAVVQHIEKEHIAQILFPLLENQSAQTEINTLALRANALRHEAWQLEQGALKIMNDEVICAK